MASSQGAFLTFFTGLRGFHVYHSCWKPYVKQKIEYRKETNNQCDKYAVAGYIKLPGKMVLCVVGHMPREISRYTCLQLKEVPMLQLKLFRQIRRQKQSKNIR